jgi:CHAD domain-containing protein
MEGRMPYRLKAHEEPAQGIKRIVCEQIDEAIQTLTDHEVDRHIGVHQARKCFKKIRGVLRLVRAELGDVFRTENNWFRDIGRELSHVRDAEALLETFDKLRRTFAEQLRPHALRAIRKGLVQRRQTIADEQVDVDKRVESIVAALGEAKQRVRSWPLFLQTHAALDTGLQQTYRRGRRAREVAYRDPTPENFHEWRKRVKDHWYHLRILEAVWPEVIGGYRDALKHLSDLLGDDHDLVVFRQTLRDHPKTFGADRDIQLLLGLIDRRQAELQTQAETLGQRVFAEKPSRFCARLQQYVEAWQIETQRSTVLAE